MVQQRSKWKAVSAVRTTLTCALLLMATVALLSVHLHLHLFFPSSSAVHELSGDLDFPTSAAATTTTVTTTTTTTSTSTSTVTTTTTTTDRLDGDRGKGFDDKRLWKQPRNSDYTPCVEPTRKYKPPRESRGYLVAQTNGGLNQMRAGICDMVAIARIINATLVVPEMDKESFWRDPSNFSDVFDVEHFITALANDVTVVKELPLDLTGDTKSMQFKSWSGMDYYEGEIASLWEHYELIVAEKTDSRLANNNLPPDIQKLRCRTCYEALRFAPGIEALGKLLVEKMKSLGQYIALHLRYEEDILAFTGCIHDLPLDEAERLTEIRENTPHWKEKVINATEQRLRGKCPLTPKEAAIFLSALGYPSDTPIYIAAGDIYGGESHMSALRSRYPKLMNKEILASVEELEPFGRYSNQMAALDYIVSIESDVFIPTYLGNMARAVAGHRRFLGHRKTITPDKKNLVRLFDNIRNGKMKEGKKLSSRIVDVHKRRQGSARKRKGPISGTKGIERFRSEEPFYENPLPDCLCQRLSQNLNVSLVIDS